MGRYRNYVTVEVDVSDVSDVLNDMDDDELIEELKSRNIEGFDVDVLEKIHYAAQRKDHKTISKILEDLIYEKMGRVIAIDL